MSVQPLEAWGGRPSGATQREYDEQLVLALLLDDPAAHAWELSGLDPLWFSVPLHRKVAAAICQVRDSGRRVHWRRVGVAAGPSRSPARVLARALYYRAGASFGLTAAISRLQFAAARRSA